MGVHVVDLEVPGSSGDDAVRGLQESVAVERAALTHTWGDPSFAETYPEVTAWLRDQSHGRRERFLAVDEHGRAVGTALLELPEPDNTHLATAWVAVVPERRGLGVGSALAQHVEERARAGHRQVVYGWSEAGSAEMSTPGAVGIASTPDVLVPTSGSGHLPLTAAARFARGRGYSLEQVERHSFLNLPVARDRLDRLGRAAADAAGRDYRLRTWLDAAPDDLLESYAVLHTRMSTDVPLGGLDFEEDVFDAARVRDLERVHRESGHRLVVSAAEHVPSGVLAAFTVLVVREGEPPTLFQDSTLVLREHRGRRLGLLVKVANLVAAESAFPDARRVDTWNAFENVHMLAINDALGFVPGGAQGQWQKRLS